MNKANRQKRLIHSPLIAIPAVLLIRVAILTACSAIAFASDDPAALVTGMAYTAKLVSELASGIIIARAVGDSFNKLTRITLATAASLIINMTELFIGKAICPGTPSGLVLLPIAAVISALGAAIASKRKITKKRKKSRR